MKYPWLLVASVQGECCGKSHLFFRKSKITNLAKAIKKFETYLESKGWEVGDITGVKA